MSILPKSQEIVLTAKQRISDSLNFLSPGHSLIQGGTGMGKSTFVMKYLAQNNQIVMLCPLVAQVEQLQQIYGDNGAYVFIHGNQSISKNEIPAVIRKHLVMTYDQFAKFEPYLSSKAIIVVDEVQKLYSVGTYREKPIQYLLEVVKNQKFERIVFLTATLTSHLFEKLNIQISQYYKFTQTSQHQRSISIVNPTTFNSRYWVYDVLKRLKKLQKKQCKKVIVIRVNDIEIAKQVKEIYKKEGFNTQLINSKEMSNPDCQELLSLERINTEYDAVICTSILDEAINLKNGNEEIDSIHIVW
ncbi:DEAD/DEAH box helicase family protein [Acinetobacter baumannii]|nr:DEAD/DEAH box helicase family protein [Acinetobacter baumannii]